MNIYTLLLALLAAAIVWVMMWLVILPYIRLQLRCRASRNRVPHPEELWVQDERDLLYIDAVTPQGVEIMMYDARTKQFMRWRDTWEEWHKRLQLRTVYFSGHRRPLGTA